MKAAKPWVEREIPLFCKCQHAERRHNGPCTVYGCKCRKFREETYELWTRDGEYKGA